MKNFIILIFAVLTLQSCRSDYIVYMSNPKLGADAIFAYRLEDFFNGKNRIKKLRISDFNLLKVELEKIKDTLNKVNPLPRGGEKFGIYKYAFIISTDTLYSNSTLKGWRYKKKVCLYENLNIKIKDDILNKTNWVNVSN